MADTVLPETGARRRTLLPRRKRVPRAQDDGFRQFVTPEGVDLGLKIGQVGDRAAALLLDLAILLATLLTFTIASCSAGFASGKHAQAMVTIVWVVGAFVLRNFYFTAFELSARAATPGKRVMGLRVIARDGGRLTAGAVFARNAMRELELFMPAMLLLATGGLEGVDAWMALAAIVWTGIFLLFPLFNRDRLRAGDLIAGTMVVRSPKKVLRPDLVEEGVERRGQLNFTQAQLDAYGVKELHVLEEVLRRGDTRTQADVARRIRRKISWPDVADVSDRTFLSAYYAALRGRLETRMLFGRRRKDKFDLG